MKLSSSAVDCLVPFYNEGPRLTRTLHFLLKINDTSRIICVNDGSTEKLTLPSNPKIILENLPHNVGKTLAVKAGLKHITSQSVLLFDADLFNCNQADLETAISQFLSHSDIRLLILKRMNDHWINQLIRTNIVLSGQRLLRTQDLKAILEKPIKPYQLELAINDFMLKNNLKYSWRNSPAGTSIKSKNMA